MFEGLTQRLTGALRSFLGKGKLTEANMEVGLQEVSRALLSADVHFRVVREFVQKVQTACIGQAVIESVRPDQQIVKIIHDELVTLLGGAQPAELPSRKPLKILLAGLHGSGKTTSAAKLARFLAKKQNYVPALIACDVYRPAAIDQLEILAQQLGVFFYGERGHTNVLQIAQNGLKAAQAAGANCFIFDTAGRLQIDAELIEEVRTLKARLDPEEVFLVADIALGQEAVNVAQAFHQALNLTGLVVTKLDGDARGGAALSMKAITHVPIRFMGFGEHVEDFDAFYPDRMASRILGMGDVVSLVERAQEAIDQKQAQSFMDKMQSGQFTLEDMLQQMRQARKLGPLNQLMKLLPGMANQSITPEQEKKMKQAEAILLSMRPQERRNPDLLAQPGRRMRIANGSGTLLKDVNALLKQYQEMKKMMQMMLGSKGQKLLKRMAADPQLASRLPQ